MEKDSIVFQPMSGEKESLSAVRKAFRVPVADSENVQVFWKEKQCAVLNISTGGVSVVCDDAFDVECDDVCGGWELKLGNIQLYNLFARVIHVSSIASGRFVCGIQWIDLEETQKVAIDGAVACMKAQVLGNNDRNIPPIQDV
ncbi:PilZ domain-containing protein [Desulfocicer niacini]